MIPHSYFEWQKDLEERQQKKDYEDYKNWLAWKKRDDENEKKSD